MKVLISFCNQGVETYNKNLLLYDFNNGNKEYLFKSSGGFTGLAQDSNYIYAILQASPNRLIIISKTTLQIILDQELVHSIDAHSIIVKKNKLYVVSTGSDSVLQYKFNKKSQSIKYVKKYWGVLGSDCIEDTHHVNSIFINKNNIYVSAFGPKEGLKWSSAKKGYIENISKNKLVIKNIFHPHSLFIYDANFYYCESASSVIKKDDTAIISLKSGYVRGLSVLDDNVVFGISGGRKVSKSTGLVNKFAEAGLMPANCKVLVYKMTSGKYIKKHEVNLYPKHTEIYDVLIV